MNFTSFSQSNISNFVQSKIFLTSSVKYFSLRSVKYFSLRSVKYFSHYSVKYFSLRSVKYFSLHLIKYFSLNSVKTISHFIRSNISHLLPKLSFPWLYHTHQYRRHTGCSYWQDDRNVRTHRLTIHTLWGGGKKDNILIKIIIKEISYIDIFVMLFKSVLSEQFHISTKIVKVVNLEPLVNLAMNGINLMWDQTKIN